MAIKIDLKTYIGDFNWTKQEMEDMLEFIAVEYSNLYRAELIDLAQTRLRSSRQAYIDGIEVEKKSRFQYRILLNGDLPAMIEEGATAFDLKTGLLQSPKAKTGKNGNRYITVPFAFRTSSASVKSGLPGQVLPRVIYDLIRNNPAKVQETDETVISSITGNQIGEKYQPKEKNVVYENKAHKYIPKSSIFAGLQRTQNKETGKSTYNTFRRVSKNSDPISWIHPGIRAYNLMDEAMKNADIEKAIDRGLDEYFFQNS